MLYLAYNGKMVQANHKYLIAAGSPAPMFDLILTFDDIGSAPVGDPTSVSDWNTWFDLPTWGSPFTNVAVLGDVVTLSGGSNITLKDYLFGDDAAAGPGLLSIVDTGCITNTGWGTFSDDGDEGYGCYNLTTAVFPGLTSIGDYSFMNAVSLTSFTIPNGVSIIPAYSFSGTGLTTISIPASITNIDGTAFENCLNFTGFNVSGSNSDYSDISGVLFDKIQSTIISYPRGKVGTSYSIPNGVITIGLSAFANCILENITMPNTVITMDNHAFDTCSALTNITLSSNLSNISGWGFSNCSSLGGITIPSSVTLISNDAFRFCISLPNITIPDGVSDIQDNTFWGCSLLTDVSLGNGLTAIGNYAFYTTGLTNIQIPNNIITIGDNAFASCGSLTTALIGNGVTTIGPSAFYACSSLTDVLLGNSVQSIGYAAFGFTSITDVTIPASVTFIDDYAYYQCIPSLYNLYPLAAPTIGGSNAFGDYAKPLHIQSSGTSGYNVSPWTNVAKFSSIIQDL